jgi:dGTPase
VERELRKVRSDWNSTRWKRQWEPSDAERQRKSYRTPQQRDRDRVLYCSALQRLSSVTQVTAPESGYRFHDRLSHSLKVAQVGRRNAERLQILADQGEIDGLAADLVRSLDPDAVEASCLAHDLGHPPFGHIAETVLHEKASQHVADGFEGNAQSFRIVTQLAVRDGEVPGLNLTRETLDYLLKYPWRHWPKDPMKDAKRERKWGYYEGGDDEKSFKFARKGWPKEAKTKLPQRSMGAEIMDWADDLTYAVHDVDDFFRAGLVPLDRLGRGPNDPEIKRFEELLTEVRDADPVQFPNYGIDELVESVREALSLGPGEPYRYTAAARADLREFGSKLITRYLEAFMVRNDSGKDAVVLSIDPEIVREVTALKMLVVVYVIHRPGLTVVQHGQQRLIRELFDFYFAACAPDRNGNHHLLPPGAKERLEAGRHTSATRARVVVDLISGLTETAAVQLHQRLCGWGTGSALDATALMG